MKKITVESAVKLIKSTNGTIFSVQFTKADGSTRVLNGRTGVHKGVTGKGQAYDPAEHDLLTVYDMQKKAYRMVRTTTIKLVTVGGVTYSVI